MNFIIVQVLFCDKPINWKAMNSDRIEPKGQVKGPRIDFFMCSIKVTKKSCKIIYINIVAILLLAAVLCYAQTAQSLSSQQLEPKGWEKRLTIVSK